MKYVNAVRLSELRAVYDAVRSVELPTRSEVAKVAADGGMAETARLLTSLEENGLVERRILSELEEAVWRPNTKLKFDEVLAVHPEGEDRIGCMFQPIALRPGDIAEVNGSKAIIVAIRSAPAGSEVEFRRVFATGRVASELQATFCAFYDTYKVVGLTPAASASSVANVKAVQPEQKGSTMAKVVRKGGAKKAAAKPAAKKASGGTATKTRRTQADVDALASAFQEHLAGGGKMKALKEEYGFSDDGPIRAALYRAGFDSKGEEHGVEEGDMSSLTPAKLKAAVVKEREAGTPWYALAYRTGETEPALKKIVADAGGPTGRVYRAPKEKPAAAAKSGAKKSGKKVSRKATAADPS